ncbi:MAG TPA: hypothetical protein VFU49_02850 [Ktedonobacteraceae bacterium]|nr:hypothetical protein [Ktedonobacteraceae bacterium]
MQDNPPQSSEKQPEDLSQEQQPSQTTESEEMPLWLRKKVGQPQEAEQVSTMPDDSAAKEVTQLREELACNQHQLSAMHARLSSMQEQQYTAPRERGGCLTTWLIFLGIVNATASFIFLGIVNALVLVFGLLSVIIGGLGGLDSPLYLVSSVVVLISIVGIWQLKKWGYYTLMTCYTINFVFAILTLCVQSSSIGLVPYTVGGVIGTIIGMIITYLLVHDRWETFDQRNQIRRGSAPTEFPYVGPRRLN